MKQVVRITENNLHNIIYQAIQRIVTENKKVEKKHITLYHCFDGEIDKEPFIWLSSVKDQTYGSKIAEFSIPIDKFNLANKDDIISYIKKYDIRSFQDAIYDEYIEMGLDWFDWKAYKNGEISDEQAYREIPYRSWAEIMEHPQNYTFMDVMKKDGFDGYYFDYLGFGGIYYLVFDVHKVLPYLTKVTQ